MSSATIHVDIGQDHGTGSQSHTTYKAATTIPLEVQQFMPNKSLAIPLLLTYSFPLVIVANEEGLPSPSTCLSNLEPLWDIGTLSLASIPPRKWVYNIGIELSGRWVSGNAVVSIQHPANPGLRLPIWGAMYWDKMTSALREQGKWKKALEWVLKQRDCAEKAAVLDTIGSTPWGLKTGSVDPSSVFIGTISDLLSNGWLRETHLDIMVAIFNASCPSGWYAAASYLATTLQSPAIRTPAQGSDEVVKADEYLNRLLAEMTARSATHLVFPVNLNDNHWVVMHVDITKGKYMYGAPPHPSCQVESMLTGSCTYRRRLSLL